MGLFFPDFYPKKPYFGRIFFGYFFVFLLGLHP